MKGRSKNLKYAKKEKDFARKSKIVNNDDSSVSVSSDLIDKSIHNLITSNNDASSILLQSSTSRPTSLSADVDDCEIPGPSKCCYFWQLSNKKYTKTSSIP